MRGLSFLCRYETKCKKTLQNVLTIISNGAIMSTSKDKGAIMKTKFAIKIRWLDYNHKWHQHTTKWHDYSGDAWEEADKFEKTIKWLEMSRGLARKCL